MGLLMYVGLELGTPSVLADGVFFDYLLSSYMWSLVLILPISYFFIKYAVRITNIPFKWYFWPIIASLIWSCSQYTGLIDDYIMFALCCIAGILLKYIRFSRVSFLIGYILSARVEASWVQFNGLYTITDLFTNWLPLTFLIMAVLAAVWGLIYNKVRIEFV